MDRVGQILRALFRRALSEHGRDAPALTDIVIERAHGRLEPRIGVQFSNGYRTWSPLSPSDCYAFCERHATWELGGLRAALLREGYPVYAQMREEHAAELLALARARRGELGERRTHRVRRTFPQGFGLARIVAEHAGPVQHVGDAERRSVGDRLAHPPRQPGEALERLRAERRLAARGGGSREAEAAVDLAAREARHRELAQAGLAVPQLFRDPELHVQEPAVHAAQLECNRARGDLAGHRGVSRHAADHGLFLLSWSAGFTLPG